MIKPVIRTFITSDGYEHHYRHWLPEGSPRATIVALHGIQSHSGWYEASSRMLCEAGYEILFLDRRGSGLNTESRGYVRHADRFIRDVTQCIEDVRRQHSAAGLECSTVLLGLSWGGKLATAVASRRPELCDKLILLYPGLFSFFRASDWDNFRLDLAKFGDVLLKRVPTPLQDPKLFTDDPKWCDYIKSDALSLREVTVAFLLANRDLDRISQGAAAAIKMPTFVALAGRDRIICNLAVRTFLTFLGTSHLKIIEYQKAAHTLEFDPARDQFVTDLIQWLNVECPASEPGCR